MPQKDKLIRKEYNRQQYILKKNKEQPIEKESNSITDNYYLLKFFKNIQKVNDLYLSVTLTPIKVEQDLKTKIIDDINKYIVTNINRYDEPKFKFNYVVLELKFRNKSFIKIKKKGDYEGCYYEYKYVMGAHYYLKNNPHIHFNHIKPDHWKTNKYIEEYFKLYFPDYKNDNLLNEWFYNETRNQVDIDKYLYSSFKIKTETYQIKIKEWFHKFDYEKSPKSHFDSTNLKKWDNKKTASVGLKFNDLKLNQNCYNEIRRITLDELKKFCKTNGLDQKISKHYKYSDYANWMLKVLS